MEQSRYIRSRLVQLCLLKSLHVRLFSPKIERKRLSRFRPIIILRIINKLQNEILDPRPR